MRPGLISARAAALALCAAVLIAGAARAAIGSGVLRGPYPPWGKAVAWALGVPEPAYQFAVVAPGIYRSARPDERFLRYLQREHGVARIVNLAGPSSHEQVAAELGMTVESFHWSVDQPPAEHELAAVLQHLDGGPPLLVHCASGSDRTGYAVAVYRVRRQGWSLEAAVAEMRRFWHRPERHAALHEGLRAATSRP